MCDDSGIKFLFFLVLYRVVVVFLFGGRRTSQEGRRRRVLQINCGTSGTSYLRIS